MKSEMIISKIFNQKKRKIQSKLQFKIEFLLTELAIDTTKPMKFFPTSREIQLFNHPNCNKSQNFGKKEDLKVRDLILCLWSATF